MADVTSVAITSGIPSSGTGSVRTIGAMFLSSNIQYTGLSTANGANTVTLSSAPSAVISSGTVTLSSNPTVIASSIWSVNLSTSPGANTVTLSSAPAISVGTVEISSASTFLTPAGSPSAALVVSVQMSTTPNSSAYALTVQALGLAQATTVTGQSGNLVFGSVSSAVPTYASTTVNSISVDLAGGLRSALVPTTAGGLSVSSVVLSNTTNATNIKTSGGQVYKVEGFNVSTAVAFLKMYNLSSTPTAGTTTAITIYTIPCSSQGAGLASEITNGIAYATGIGYTVTSSMTSSDTTALPTANAVTVNVYYK
jgi:hypothetical protein